MKGAAREHWLLPQEPYRSYDAYLADVGASAVARARLLPAEVVLDEIGHSGLRGRGGAGFPTGVKWRSLSAHACEARYVVCNAAEGEPGTFKDRWLLRRNPYATIEGMLIAAHVLGARAAYIAMKASFRPELEAVRRALDEMRGAGALGGLPFEVVEGPEEYLFGEEKALLNVIEGEGPLPRPAESPPYEVGLFATARSPNPALVNNAETYAHVPSIVRAGAASFRRLGTADTPGTVLYTLSGDLQRPGVYELEAGLPLRRLFEEVGGGPLPGRRLVAALSGVSSGVIVAEQFDARADFGSLSLLGAGLGSAGFVVLDDTRSMARVAQSVARFLYVESCNQCSACKTGLRIASRSLDALFDGERATSDLVERAVVAAQHAPQGNRCYLPVQASVLIPSLVRRFRSELAVQAQTGDGSAPPFVLPKLVDFDEAAGRFVYDETQARKQPDWTYRPEEPAAEAGSRRRSTPAARPTGPVSVHLGADTAAALAALADAAGIDLDHQIDAALREWLDAKKRPTS